MDDILRLVSFVNWHLTPRDLHSLQDAVSVASHCEMLVLVALPHERVKPTLTFLSLQASQDGSFRLCLYGLFVCTPGNACIPPGFAD
jgi:hypothetical protein